MKNSFDIESLNGDVYTFVIKAPSVRQMRALNKQRAVLADDQGNMRSNITPEMLEEVQDNFVEATVTRVECDGEVIDDIFDISSDVYNQLFMEITTFLTQTAANGENTEN